MNLRASITLRTKKGNTSMLRLTHSIVMSVNFETTW